MLMICGYLPVKKASLKLKLGNKYCKDRIVTHIFIGLESVAEVKLSLHLILNGKIKIHDSIVLFNVAHFTKVIFQQFFLFLASLQRMNEKVHSGFRVGISV